MDRATLLDEMYRYAEENLVAKDFHPGKTYIPPTFPILKPEDIRMVADATLNFWYTEHKYCRRFEKSLQKLFGKQNCLLTNSGSSASLVAITTATKHLNTSRYVITCAVGFPTTVAPIMQNGRIPIFIDMDRNFQPDYDQLWSALNSIYKSEIAGVVLAHTLGFPFDEARVRDMLYPDQFLVADCCDAVGALLPDGKPVGSYADLVTVSFFPAHHIMAAEGGAVLTNDYMMDRDAASYANWGRSCYCRPGEQNTCGIRFDWENRGELPEGWDHKYIFDRLGYNLKMTEFQAALGYSQSQRVDEIVAARKNNYNYLYSQLYHGENGRFLYTPAPDDNASPFGFPITVTLDDHELDTPNSTAATFRMIAFLEKHKVGTRRVFGGNIIRQPGFLDERFLYLDELWKSDMLAANSFWISVSPTLTTEMMDYMVYVIELFLVEEKLINGRED